MKGWGGRIALLLAAACLAGCFGGGKAEAPPSLTPAQQIALRGHGCLERGESARAVEHYQEALRLARLADHRADQAEQHYNLAACAYLAGAYEPALLRSRRAEQLTREVAGDPLEVQLLQARILRASGQGAAAREKLKDCPQPEGRLARFRLRSLQASLDVEMNELAAGRKRLAELSRLASKLNESQRMDVQLLEARILEKEDKMVEAADMLENAVARAPQAGRTAEVSALLLRGANARAAAGQAPAAARLQLRAARAFLAGGHTMQAAAALDAVETLDSTLAPDIRTALRGEIEQAEDPKEGEQP